MISLAGGSGKSGFYVQVGEKYGKPKPGTAGLGGAHLDRGRKYGIMVTNRFVGQDTVAQLYIQDISAGETTPLTIEYIMYAQPN